MKEHINETKFINPFGNCPFCLSPLHWDNDESWCEDDTVIIRYLTCPVCGASIEALECIPEERCNYTEYWGEDTFTTDKNEEQ